VRGADRESKFYYNLQISESTSILPSTIRKMLADLKRESKGDDDFGYNNFEITSITGTVARAGETWTFVARGSSQKYELVPNAALKKLVEGGKSLLTLAGLVTDEEGKVRLEISDAKEATN
jgi:hypothetical protein